MFFRFLQQPNQNRGWQLQGGMNHQLQNNRQPQHHQQQQQQNPQQQQQRNNRPRQNNGGRQFTRAPGPRPKTQPLKFESDYDFDKANSEFEELKSEISKLKISSK